MAVEHQATQERQIIEKYKNINSLSKSEKKTALADPKINPFLLKDPYDGLAASMNKWKDVANDAVSKGYSEDDKAKAASNYYDHVIGPMYAQMKLAPINKDLWMKNAYTNGMKYSLDDAYDNSFVHGLENGLHSGWAATENAAATVSSAIGIGAKAASLFNPLDDRPFFQRLGNLHNEIAQKGILGAGSDFGDTHLGLFGMEAAAARKNAPTQQFWADALPNKDFTAKATSFVAEQVAQLPVYAAMAAGGEIGGAVVEGVPAVSNLTKALLSNPIGQKAFPYLMAGGEGLAYGTLTRPQEDKTQAWKDALGFMAFHTLFSIGGGAVSKLADVAKGTPLAKAVEDRGEELDLAQKGQRKADPTEEYEAHVEEAANNIAVIGSQGQMAVIADALKHVKRQQESGMSREAITAEHMRLLDPATGDPAANSPVLSAAKYIRTLLGDKKLSDLDEHETDLLHEKLEQLVKDASVSTNEHVEGLQGQTAASAAGEAHKPGSKITLDFYREKAHTELEQSGASKLVTPQQIEARAQQMYAEANVKAGQRAEAKLKSKPVDEANNIARKRQDKIQLGQESEKPSTSTVAGRTKGRYNFGLPAKASAKHNASYITYLKGKVPSLEPGELTKFYQDMEPKDFAKDLEDHFYPQDLKNAGVYFESEKTREGWNNPNFFGFMLNYKDQMPKELGQELARRIEDSPKFEQSFKKYNSNKKPTEDQIWHFALQMYNHVDDFLSATSHVRKGQTNVFRTSYSDLLNPTVYQKQLLKERSDEEVKNIRTMFRGSSKAKKQALSSALNAHALLSTERAQLYSGRQTIKSTERIRDISDEISGKEVESGTFIPWRF